MNVTRSVRKKTVVLSILLLFLFCYAGSAAAEADKWQYEAAIYGWLPSIDGKLKYGLPPGEGGGNATVDASDILDSLNFVFMGAFQARYNRWSLAADLIYMDLSNSKGTDVTLGPPPGVPVDVSAKLSLTAWLVTGVAGYDLVQTEKTRLAVIGGVRYLNLDADLKLSAAGPMETPPPAYLSDSVTLWDGIVGVKGGFMLTEHWYIPYYADIGAGDSQITWQLYTGIGYRFERVDVVLGYRYLEYDQDDDKFLQDLSFYGPLLGVGFRF